MKHTFLSLIVFLSLHCCAQSNFALVPAPVELRAGSGSFNLKQQVTVSSNFPEINFSRLFPYFKKELEKQFGISASMAKDNQQGDIRFEMQRMPTSGAPAYRLSVTEKAITITSNFEEPAFNAMQTLFQLIPARNGQSRLVPAVEIFDYARFNYRGMHLDVSRHFWKVDFIKKLLDQLAYHKMNVFHWHLTDDQGWRIPIRKFPLLTTIGATRNGWIIGRYPGTGNDNVETHDAYTREEIQEVVSYAAERFIQVIPEIDGPGHTSAAIAAYPWLSCFPLKPTQIPPSMISEKSKQQLANGRIKLVQETAGDFDDEFCIGNDSTFMFMEAVVDELIELFPSKYIHIGGDETHKTHWKTCPKCQQRMKDNNLKTVEELQSYYVHRLEQYINSKGKSIIGWNEILQGGLAPNATVMSWQGVQGGITAAKMGHDAIMTPGNPLYFDHTQSDREDSVTFGGYNPIQLVYAYEPVSPNLTAEEAKHILGAQANVWTEYMYNTKKVEYMIFPRLSALSEMLWTKKENRSWVNFEKRLPAEFERYIRQDINPSYAYYDVQARSTSTADHQGISWQVKHRMPGKAQLKFYQVNAKSPKSLNEKLIKTVNSDSDAIIIRSSGIYRAEAKIIGSKPNEKKFPPMSVSQQFRFGKATGKSITLNVIPKIYPGNGPFTLVDGIINDKGFKRTSEFLGWSGDDCEAIIDLDSLQEISFVVVNALKRRTSWIWEPAGAEVFGSSDGITWYSIKQSTTLTAGEGEKVSIQLPFRKTFTRYVKVVVKNWGTIPEGNAGAGRKAWLFIDEIEIN